MVLIVLVMCPYTSISQDPDGNYNPYVNQGIISPSPLWPVEANGTGNTSFNIGNTGSDPLDVFSGHQIILTITLSYGIPDGTDPLSAVTGTSADLFAWEYESGTYTAVQTSTIPAGSSGTINIAYKVTQNSSFPGSNGFNVNLTPAPYQTTSNSLNDDAVSSYTYTEIRDYGDAPESYGTAYHVMDFTNYLGSACDGEYTSYYSSSANGDDLAGEDDEDGVAIDSLVDQGESMNIPVSVTGTGYLNAWIDWNGDGDFHDTDERVADNIPRNEGTENLTVTVPEITATSMQTFARFRFSPGVLSSSDGAAIGGEVEDYCFTILGNTLVTRINVTPEEGVTEIETGETLQFSAEVLPPEASNKSVTWSVTNQTGSATITGDGLMTAISAGTVSVVATAQDGSGVTGSIQITIVDPVVLVSRIIVTSEGEVTEIYADESLQFYAEVLPSDATNNDITWSVENITGEATILQEGILTAVSEGIVDVVATAQDGSGISGSQSIQIIEQNFPPGDTDTLNVNVYPNPGKGKFHLDVGSADIILIQIIDGNGLIRKEIIPDPENLIIPVDLTTISSGIYILKIYSEKASAGRRIIIQSEK